MARRQRMNKEKYTQKNKQKWNWLQLFIGAGIGALGLLVAMNFFANNWFASQHTCSMMRTSLLYSPGFWLLSGIIVIAIIVMAINYYNRR
ncbi:hypothetical protein COV14_04845 [Candidatus Woesearchaeota archaeon CG10_big_fil_rev_8_21_14_0_10_33_12]|nr:MAG: hypothetical protein COV14_04845 [Candidatus Woesearchaeota archaeon CG10_big_fil_rev_8_21_14_0_10_33_12]